MVGCLLLLLGPGPHHPAVLLGGPERQLPLLRLCIHGDRRDAAGPGILQGGHVPVHLPVMGLTLPFFSYGGSSIITLYTAMGIVSSIRARTLPSWLRDRNQL